MHQLFIEWIYALANEWIVYNPIRFHYCFGTKEISMQKVQWAANRNKVFYDSENL